MAEARAYGLKHIKMGDVDAGGGMGQSLTAVGSIRQDTCDLISDDPQVDDVFAEQDDLPKETFVTTGITTLKFSLMDVSATTLEQIMGGTETSGKWEAPKNTPDIEQSIEIETRNGLKIEIPRAKIYATFNYQFRKRDVIVVDVTARILVPEDGSAPITQELTS